MVQQRPDDGAPTGAPSGAPSADALTQLHRYRVEQGVEAAWLVDVEGRITHANQEAGRIVGRTPAELAGLSITALLDEEGARQFEEYLELMRSRHPGEDSVEVLLHRPDGTPVWTLTSWRPLQDDDGVLLGWGHTFSELSDHRRIVDKLRLREKQLAQAQAVAHVGSWELRSDTGELWWSDELYRIVGRQPGLGPGPIDRVIASVHPDDRPSLVRMASRPTAGFGGESWTGRVVRPDGTVRCVRMHWLTHQSSDDDTMRVTGTMEDITELHETHERAERAREDLLLLQGVAEAANRAQSLDTVLERSVEAVARHSGWRATGYLRRDPARSDPPTWHPAPEEGAPDPLAPDLVERALASGRPETRPREDLPGFSLVAVPVLRQDEVVRVVEMSANTPEPGAYLALAAHAASILGHVAVREHVVAQLAEARDAALDVSAHKSTFLAAVSHELRTPMNGVLGLADLLLETPLDERQRRMLRQLRGAGDTLVGIISDILDFSAIESGRVELVEEDVDVRAVLDHAVAMLAATAADRGLDLAAWCEGEVPARVRGDRLRLEQVVVNLGSNAVRFTDEGQVALRAMVVDDELRLEVADTGPGLEAADCDRLLEPFTQGDASTTRRHGGTGLGLSIVDRFVRAMDGRLEIETSPGVGSTFACVLPLRTSGPGAHGGADGGADGSGAGAARAPLHARAVRVLVERPATRAAVIARLEAWGAVVQMPHAPQAPTPELVVLDLGLPAHDGDAPQTWSRRDLGVPDGVPLLLLGGLPGPPAAAVEALRADGAVATPVGDGELLAAVHRLLEGTAHPRPAGTDVRRAPTGAAPLARVLVVEDDPVNQLVVRGFLERLGLTVEVADDGVAAVDRVTRPDEPPLHAVLMDCQMPRLDGYGATRAIRSAQDAHRVPILALTASAVASERERCLEAGMDDFLTKPVEAAALRRALARWIPALRDEPVRPPASTPAEDPAAPPVLDLERVEMLDELVKDGVSFFVRTRSSFLGRAEEVLGELLDALDRADTATVVRLAHALKGAAGNLGLARLAAVAAEVEQAARRGDDPAGRPDGPVGTDGVRDRLAEQMRLAVEALTRHPA